MANEKRLIDVNALLHDTVWLCGGFVGDPYSDGYMDALDKVETVIRELPTVDAVEVVQVVRCKDCKHFDMQRMECQCDAIVTDNEGGADFTVNFGPDDFCSYGERRTT